MKTQKCPDCNMGDSYSTKNLDICAYCQRMVGKFGYEFWKKEIVVEDPDKELDKKA
jgi:hypothetical protein